MAQTSLAEDAVAPWKASPVTTYDASSANDAWLFGWDAMPGIVSVWADRDGRARLWQRTTAGVRCVADRFRPWLFAASLDDLHHLGPALVDAGASGAEEAPFSYRKLDGPSGSLRYLLSARDGRALSRAILAGAGRRLGRELQGLRGLPDEVGSSRVDLQACKLEYSIVSPK